MSLQEVRQGGARPSFEANNPEHVAHNLAEQQQGELQYAEKQQYDVESLKASEIEFKDDFAIDPFKPFDDLPDEHRNIFTVRAVIVGVICGALVNASNVYLGLKTGWTFSANLFGSIAGFAVLKSLSKALPSGFPIFGGEFGPRENNIVQTVAMAAGGMSSVFVSGIPAIYQLHLLKTPKEDFWRLVSLTAVGGYFGFFFATPLRKFFIIYVARELRLIFPSASATALTIRSMHQAVSGEVMGKLKMKAMSYAFVAAFILRVVSQYAIGILWDWHIFTWFFIWGNYNNAAIYIENFGWFIEWTPAFIGSGMLVGMNVGVSFFAGTVLSWAIIAPALVKTGRAYMADLSEGPDDKWYGYQSPFSLSAKFANKTHPSPRYWLLWPAVLSMICISFAELALQWRMFVIAAKAVWSGTSAGIYQISRIGGKEGSGFWKRQAELELDDPVEDSAAPEDLVKLWMYFPLLIVTIICMCVVLGVQYDMPVGMSLLSVFLAFFFSFLAIQCTGVTDVTPLTAASKASQLILGGATKGEHWATEKAQLLNLIGGSLASIGAGQATDLVCDFRTGFLLRTPPKWQFLAQGLGTIVAVFLAPSIFMLFTTAYPCIIDSEIDNCPFGYPSVSAWRATAVAVTDPTFPVPPSSGFFAIAWSIFGVLLVLIRQFVWVGKLEWVKKYHPNVMCLGLAMVLPYTVYSTAMLMGSTVAYFWAKKNPKQFDTYGYAVAAGLIAGEGIGGVINAVFEVASIAGTQYGSQIACPGGSC